MIGPRSEGRETSVKAALRLAIKRFRLDLLSIESLNPYILQLQ